MPHFSSGIFRNIDSKGRHLCIVIDNSYVRGIILLYLCPQLCCSFGFGVVTLDIEPRVFILKQCPYPLVQASLRTASVSQIFVITGMYHPPDLISNSTCYVPCWLLCAFYIFCICSWIAPGVQGGENKAHCLGLYKCTLCVHKVTQLPNKMSLRTCPHH